VESLRNTPRDLEMQSRSDVRSRPGSRRSEHDSRQDANRVPMSLDEILRRYERLIIIQVLQANDFSRAKAAKSLRVSRNNLWRRMKLLKIDFSEMPPVHMGRPRKESSL
jgi:DNA-binding NtrC family response regulator